MFHFVYILGDNFISTRSLNCCLPSNFNLHTFIFFLNVKLLFKNFFTKVLDFVKLVNFNFSLYIYIQKI